MDPRQKMIREITEKYNLNSPGIFFAMKAIPREEFVPQNLKHLAYEDGPLPIGSGQTISQPYTVAFMTHLLISGEKSSSAKVTKDWKVLEIGTGSGYQAAILSKLADKVYTIERIKNLSEKAKKTLKKLRLKNVFLKTGQGEEGWKEKSPFDAIIITAGVEKVPKELFRQLKEGGVLVVPEGKGMDKTMIKYIKRQSRITKQEYGTFVFVPLITSKMLK